MPQATDFANRIIALVEAAVDRFSDGLDVSSAAVAREIELLIQQLTLKNGQVVPSVANLKILNSIDRKVTQALNSSGYRSKLSEFIGNYSTIGSINHEYFAGVAEAFVPNEALFNSIKEFAIEQALESLSGAGLDNAFKEPIKKILSQNISSGADFFDMRKQVLDFINGGRLQKYAGQITRDALSQFSASYHEQISNDLGLQWYLYRGGTVKDTRPFCAARAGKYFHRREVEAWASQEWAGKIPGTTASTIYVYRGGFSCLHLIVAVSESVVPKSDLDRINKG